MTARRWVCPTTAGASSPRRRPRTRRGAETSELQLRDERWRPLSDPVAAPGLRQSRRCSSTAAESWPWPWTSRSWCSTYGPVACDAQVHAHSGALLQMVVAGPEADMIWTAGRDGNAVALDLRSAQGILRRLPRQREGQHRRRGRRGCRGQQLLRHPSSTPSASWTSGRVRTGSVSSQPLETCGASRRRPPSLPTDGSPSWPSSSSVRTSSSSPSVVACSSSTPRAARSVRTIDTPVGGHQASRSALTVSACSSMESGGYALVRRGQSGEAVWRRESRGSAPAWSSGLPSGRLLAVMASRRPCPGARASCVVDLGNGRGAAERRARRARSCSGVSCSMPTGRHPRRRLASGRLYFLDAGTLEPVAPGPGGHRQLRVRRCSSVPMTARSWP